MALYSYKGGFPAELPDRVRLDDGLTRTHLDELTQEELTDIGFSNPITEPTYDASTHELSWDGTTLSVVSIPEAEPELSDQAKLLLTEKDNILNARDAEPALVGAGWSAGDTGYASIDDVPADERGYTSEEDRGF